MARTVTLSQLRTDCRLFADQRHGGATPFISDTEMNRLINLKTAELYDKLVAAGGHEFYAKDAAIYTISGISEYSLPDDFYQMLSLIAEWGSMDSEALTDLATLALAPQYTNYSLWGSGSGKAYRLRGKKVRLYPTPNTRTTLRINYVPCFVDMVEDDDEFDGVNGWDKLVALGVAIEMRMIEQNEYADLYALYTEQLDRVEAMAADRDKNPKQVIETYPESVTRLNWFPRVRAT